MKKIRNVPGNLSFLRFMASEFSIKKRHQNFEVRQRTLCRHGIISRTSGAKN